MNVRCKSRNWTSDNLNANKQHHCEHCYTKRFSTNNYSCWNRDSTTATREMIFEPTKKPCGCVALLEACLPPAAANNDSVTLNVACGSALSDDFSQGKSERPFAKESDPCFVCVVSNVPKSLIRKMRDLLNENHGQLIYEKSWSRLLGMSCRTWNQYNVFLSVFEFTNTLELTRIERVIDS